MSNNNLNEDSVKDDQMCKTIRTCYRAAYKFGKYDTLKRLAGFYVTYKVFEFLMKKFVLYPEPILCSDDDDDDDK